nr:MAG TPA: hypothetical protein [Caudoviricetes sp.]
MTSISQQKPRRRHPLGFFIPFLQGGLCPRLVAGCDFYKSAKTPEAASSGVFYSVFAGWLMP